MRPLNPKIARQFAKSEEGVTAVIWALTLLPMMILLGFAIDWSRISSADRHLQTAVDSAVLASALDFAQNAGLPEGQRLGQAIDVFEDFYGADIAGSLTSFETLQISVSGGEDGAIRAEVTGNLPLAFGGLLGRPSINLFAASTASAAPPQDVEIVLVLDNTTSMFNNNRFNLMRSASKGFVNNLLDASIGDGATRIGVVPWATLVNINSERPGGFDVSSAADRSPNAAGTRSVPNSPFEDRLRYLLEPTEEENLTREALERDFAPVEWRGCIRSAPDERLVSSGGNVQRALTDAPVDGMRWHVSLVSPELESIDAPAGFVPPVDGVIDASFDVAPGQIFRCTQRIEQGLGNIHNNADRACSNGGNSVDFAEACVSDPNEFDYFRQGGDVCPWQRNIFPWTRFRRISGPNQNCPVAMLGLSQDRSQLIDKLDEMHPVTGGTHMDIGVMWGLRMLSPRREWSNFFGQDRPTDYDDPSARKVLVLLTDGENNPPNAIEGYYGCVEDDTRGEAGECWRAPGVQNLTEDALNGLTEDACDSLRDRYDVEIFTIAVDITDNDAIDILADCAGDPERAFNIRASEIDTVFQTLAARELRLAQ